MHKIVNREAGVTLIELAIAFAILGVLIAFAVPSVSSWMQSGAVRSAAEMYAEGLLMARDKALLRNSAARLVVGTPDGRGFSVDWCQATTDQPCDAGGNWINEVQRSGASLAGLDVTFCPGGSTEIDFTPVGWVNTLANIPIAAIRIASTTADVRSAQVEIPLSGIATICTPDAVAGDSRACQVNCQ